MSSAGSSPSSPSASPPADSTGGRRIGRRTKYVAPAASRIPRISSSMGGTRLTGEPVELATQPLELFRRGIRRNRARHRCGGCRFTRPATQRTHEERGGDDDRDRRHEVAGKVEALFGGRHQRHLSVLL